MRSILLLATPLLLACAARRPPGAEVLELAMGWPDGAILVVDVEDRVERVREHGRVEVRELAGTVRMTVRAVDDDIAIEVGAADLRQVRLDEHDVGDAVATAIGVFDISFPSVRVGADGAFRDLLDPDEAVTTLLAGLAQAFSGHEIPAAVQEIFQGLSVEPVRRRAAADWYALVGAWPGRWALGEERVEVVDDQTPGEPDMAVEVARAWLGRAPCGPTETVPRCVTMRLRRTPTVEALAAWRATIESSFGPGDPVAVESADRAEEHLVVLHPEHLLPVRVERTSRTRTTFRRADGSTFTPIDKRERRIVSYTVLLPDATEPAASPGGPR